MTAIVDTCHETASPIAFISHERKQVVIQFLIMFVDIMPLP